MKPLAVLIAGALFTLDAWGGPIGPLPYLQAADSPFAGLGFNWFHLEDFEDPSSDDLTSGNLR
jgi:hypothetical protein